jgi:integrase
MQEPEVERDEHQDDADVGRQPLPDVASEEQNVDADNDTCHRNHVERGGCRPSHQATLALGSDEPRVREILDSVSRSRRLAMIQQGQVFKLKTKGPDGQSLWAYRYRLEGRGSERPQVGGFATRAEAEKALRKVLDRLGPGGGRATITLAEFVDEYLEMHQAAPVTIAKLRWLLSKATAVLGDKRLADLSPREVYAWRMTVPEGHRFEATQSLRQVLNRAVCWGLLDYNPAKRGVPNPARRAREKRPFETWGQVEAVAAQLGPVYGPMVIFAAATGLRPSELFGLERRDVDRQLGVVYVRRAYANGRLKHTKTPLSTRAVPLQAKALEALDRLPASDNPILFPNMRGGRIDFRIFGRKHWRSAQSKAALSRTRTADPLLYRAPQAAMPRRIRTPVASKIAFGCHSFVRLRPGGPIIGRTRQIASTDPWGVIRRRRWARKETNVPASQADRAAQGA